MQPTILVEIKAVADAHDTKTVDIGKSTVAAIIAKALHDKGYGNLVILSRTPDLEDRILDLEEDSKVGMVGVDTEVKVLIRDDNQVELTMTDRKLDNWAF